MCEICDGAKSTSEMPCSKVLTEFGKILYQVVGGGPAAQMAMQTAGGLHSPSEKGREVYGNLLYGIHLGRAEEIRTERKQHRRDRWFAVELNVFSLVFGALLGAVDHLPCDSKRQLPCSNRTGQNTSAAIHKGPAMRALQLYPG